MSYTELENYIAAVNELIHILGQVSKIKISISSPSKRSPILSVYVKRAHRHASMTITVRADRSTPLDTVTRKILTELLRLSLFRAFKALKFAMHYVLALASFVLAFAVYAFSPNLGPFSVLAVAMGLSSLIELMLSYIAKKKWPDAKIWELHEKAYTIDSRYRDIYDSLYKVFHTVLHLCLASGGNGIIVTKVLPPLRYTVETAHRKHEWCTTTLEPI